MSSAVTHRGVRATLSASFREIAQVSFAHFLPRVFAVAILFFEFCAYGSISSLPQLHFFEKEHDVRCLILLSEEISPSIKVRSKKSSVSLILQRVKPASSDPIIVMHTAKVCEGVSGYEVQRSSEGFRITLNTTRSMRAKNFSLSHDGGKSFLQFDLQFSSRQGIISAKPQDLHAASSMVLRKEKSSEPAPLIVLDPGHGGIDPGSFCAGGVAEKEITLQAALALKAALLERGYRVMLTRSADRALRRMERLKKVESAKADLLISIHADFNSEVKMHGVSVYTLSPEASDIETAYLAQREDALDRRLEAQLRDAKHDVTHILDDLVEREVRLRSLKFARAIVAALDPRDRLAQKTLRSAPFLILRSAFVPSVLVELGYLSNKNDQRRVRSKAFQRKISACIAKAVDSFFLENAL